MPPAAISGIFEITLRMVGKSSRRGLSVPRWPPASVASTITAAAPSFSARVAKAGEETMETMGILWSLPILKMSRENPAPVMIMSAPASMEPITRS